MPARKSRSWPVNFITSSVVGGDLFAEGEVGMGGHGATEGVGQDPRGAQVVVGVVADALGRAGPGEEAASLVDVVLLPAPAEGTAAVLPEDLAVEAPETPGERIGQRVVRQETLIVRRVDVAERAGAVVVRLHHVEPVEAVEPAPPLRLVDDSSYVPTAGVVLTLTQ